MNKVAGGMVACILLMLLGCTTPEREMVVAGDLYEAAEGVSDALVPEMYTESMKTRDERIHAYPVGAPTTQSVNILFNRRSQRTLRTTGNQTLCTLRPSVKIVS